VNPWKQPKNGETWFNNWQDWTTWVEPVKHETPTVAGNGGSEAEGPEAGESVEETIAATRYEVDKFVRRYGNPDLSDKALAAFNNAHEFEHIQQESGCRWRRWKKVAQSRGFDPLIPSDEGTQTCMRAPQAAVAS
jgi:hypothetical protein